jgi:hypothetical protein
MTDKPKVFKMNKEQMKANQNALNQAKNLQYANMESARATAELSVPQKPKTQ